MTIHIVSHPLVQHKLSKLRQVNQTPREFRDGIKEISTFVGIEASKDLELVDVPNLQSPLAIYTGKSIAPRIGLAPILRAGLGPQEALLDLFPDAAVLHLGLFREKVSLQPIEYYSKLPENVNVDTLYILDPLIATGGTAVAAVNMILDWGLPLTSIKLLGVLGSQVGLEHVQTAFPLLDIYVAAVDTDLTDKGYISPGLGDTGDRYFNTK